MLNTDVVVTDIPLLLSRTSMKNADMTLDLKNDKVTIFGETIRLIVTCQDIMQFLLVDIKQF